MLSGVRCSIGAGLCLLHILRYPGNSTVCTANGWWLWHCWCLPDMRCTAGTGLRVLHILRYTGICISGTVSGGKL